MYYPLNYDKINIAAGTYNPSPVKVCNNASYSFWKRSLFQRACSILDFDLDDVWKGAERDFFYYCLFRYGYLAISENNEFGLFFQPCTLKGFNFYYQPTDVLINNPLYSAELKIGEECELIKLTPDYMGIWDIISYYAEKLSSLDNAINMSIINNKFAYVLGAKNKGAAEALKKIFDKINNGEPTVIYDSRILNDPKDKDTPFQFIERGALKNSYITSDQLQDFQTLLNNFDAEIGIPTIPYAKKERMVTNEADSRVVDANARCTVWLETLQSSIELVNEHYGTSFNVELRYKEEEDEHIEDDSVRDESVHET